MKVDKVSLDEQDKIKIVSQKQIEKQVKLVGRIMPCRGHTLFEIDCTTGEIREAEYKSTDILFTVAAKGDMSKHRKVMTKDNCLYISCLNKLNAKKKFLKYIMQNAIIKNKELL